MKSLSFVRQLALVGALAVLATASDEKALELSVHRVVVHMDGAVVYANASTSLSAGPNHLVLQGLVKPHSSNLSVEEASLQIDVIGGGARVQRVWWETKKSASDPEIKALSERRDAAAEAVRAAERRVYILESHERRYDRLADAVLNPNNKEAHELVKAGKDTLALLDGIAEANLKASTSVFESRSELKEASAKLSEVEEQLYSYRQQVGAMSRVAHVLVTAEEDTKEVEVATHRIVGSARWRPEYDISLDSTKQNARVQYSAIVVQDSLQNWTGVTVELATGAPSTSGKLPQVGEWELSFTPRWAENQHEGSSRRMNFAQHDKQRKRYEQQAQAMNELGELKQSSESVHGYYMASQADGGAPSQQEEEDVPQIPKEPVDSVAQAVGTSEVFVLSSAQTIPAGVETKVRVSSVNLAANLTYRAVPGRSTKAYVQAKLINDSPFSFLSGDAIVFLDGAYATSTTMCTMANGGRCVLNAGADSRVVVTWGLVSKSATTKSNGFLGSGEVIRQQHFVYETVVRNRRPFPVTLKATKALPIPAVSTIEVEMVEPKVGKITSAIKPTQLSSNVTITRRKAVEWTITVPPDGIQRVPFEFFVSAGDGHHIHGLE